MASQSIALTVLVFVLVAQRVVKSSRAFVIVARAVKSAAELLQLSIGCVNAALSLSILL